MSRPRLAKDAVTINVARVAILVAFFGLWQVSAERKWIKPLFIGKPTKMWDFLHDSLTRWDFLHEEVLTTVREATYGFVLGAIAGLVFALALSQLPRLERILSPFLTLFNAMPKVGFAPLLTLWFGLGEMSKIVLVAFIVVFIVFVPVLAALRLVDPDVVMMSRVMGANRLQLFQKTSVPAIMPALFGALRLGAVYSLLAASFGEILAAKRGLGSVLITHTNNFDISGAFGVMLILAFLALGMNGLLGLAERRLLRWQSSHTSATE